MTKKRQYLVFAFGFIFGITVAVVGWFTVDFYCASLLPENQTIDYILLPGTSSKQLAYDLHQRGILAYPRFFNLISRFQGSARNLQAGGYRITSGMTAHQLLRNMRQGDVTIETLTIVEGWTVKRLLEVMAQNKYITHTLTGLTPAEVAKRLDLKYTNPEGWFLPDTYQFAWGTTDVALLTQANQMMQLTLAQEWQNRAPGLAYKTPYQALIVASMVVKEAAIPNEESMIAAVILQRLKIGMKLQIDPTVIYGMGDKYQGNITLRDLRQPTPYNTYAHYGLPPTPISLPGQASIYAALHPVTGKYLYFVAKGDGSHVFSATLKEQDAAIKKYILHQEST